MTMHQGFDVSKLQRIKSDAKTSTFRHKNGHEIKIAHSALTPKMRDALASIPLYLAEEGEVTQMPDAPEEAPAPAEAPMPPPVEAPAPTQPVDANNSPIQVIGKRGPPTADELDNENMLFAQDLQRGHVKPETLHSLYAKKDTLGKIGTLFGLLVSGAGAGLAHQQNAVLEMMQKQIDNDLKAQESSNSNAQNWLRLSQAHAMQRAEIPKVRAETGAVKAGTAQTEAKTGAVPSEIEVNKASAAAKNAEAKVLDTTAAKNGMAIHMFKDLQDQTDKMPPGVTKDNANAKLQTEVAPGVAAYTKKNNAAAAAKVGAIRAVAPSDNTGASSTGVNDTELHKQIQLGKMGDTLAGASVGIPPSQEGEAIKEANLVKQNRAAHAAWGAGFQQLDKAFRGGVLNESARNAIVLDVASQMARAQGIQTNAEIVKLVDSMFPGVKDYGSARQNKIDYTQHQFEANEKGTTVLDMAPGLKTPFPSPPKLSKDKKDSGFSMGEGSAQAKESGPKDGDTGMSGKTPVVFRNGKWVAK